ncbi:cell division cycle-associated protein 2 isoform X2 [Alosa sapidissima]|uniref:cell division cycle-associated protein 2 isoform X2 n=1 Tax=Alosa sapidissima TaxID=34773 RepID=UPI001C0A4128|nr:cell division cycle-associated protein 2 isoform X2 [Alosa sapidissima]
MASLGSTSDMDCLNMALLDTPTSPTSPEQGGRTAPLDFPHATPLQFGITTNSFSVPSKLQDKSRVSQLKARRRSTIGVRGSPETNALIRYIAKQRMQASSPTTEHLRLQSSLPRTQTLKQKMAAFQIVMEEVDEEGKLELMITPGKSDQKLECIGAGNTHSDKLDSLLGKENRVTPGYLSPATPPPSKRVHRGPLQECEGKIRGATFSAPQEKVRVFDFQSIAHQDTTFHRQVQHMPFPVLSQQTKASLNRRDEPGVSSVTKKKRVHFGAPLSPEFFDKTLPPSTPLQKGGTPFRQPVSAGSNLRPLLKTPQRNEASIQQPDFNSPGAADGSPTLSQTKVLQGTVSSDIVFRDTEDEVPRLVLEENAEVDLVTELNSAGISEDASSNELRGSQAHVVTSLFQTEPFLEEQTAGAELKLVSSPQQQQDPATSSSPARTRGRKRKQPSAEAAAATVESEPPSERKRPSHAASTSASGKKVCQSEQKRVRFGAPLSPEFFDKTLPPSTPLHKGSTPFRQPASAGAKLCSVLKTPQRDETALQQPELCRPEATDGSPTLSHTKALEAAVSSELMLQDTEQQIPRFLLEEDDEVVPEVKSADNFKDASLDELADSQTPNMSSSYQVEPVLEKQTGAELKLVSSPQQQQEQQQQPPPPSPPPLQHEEPQQDPATSSSPARPRGRKRKPPAAADAESEPQLGRRRPSRSAALSASGKMKDSAGKRRFGSKEVDRSLYGRRVYASKNPLLSPVFESQGSSSGGVTPANPSGTSTGNGVPRKSLPTQSSQSEIVSDVVTAAGRWRQRFCPQPTEEPSDMSDLTEAQQATGDHPPEIPADGSEVSSLPSQAASSTTPRGRGRPSRANPKPKTPKAEAAPAKPTVRRSRGRRSGSLRSDAAAHMTEAQPAGEEHENVTGQSRGQIHPEAESALSSQPTRDHHESGGLQLSPRHSTETADTHGAEAALSHEPCGETEHQTVTSADGRQSPAMEGDESDVDTLQHQDPAGPSGKQRKRAVGGRAKRRSSRIQLSAVMEEGGPGQENGEVTDEKESELPAPSGLEDSGKAGVSESKGTDKNGLEDRDAQEHRVNSHADNKTSLAPWQQIEFSIEDVLKPVPSSRRSVRRSLRNRSEQVSESGAFSGLAWVAHTSPDIAAPRRAGRRRNSSRLSINLQPPNLLEEPEPQDEPEPAEP